MSTPFVSYMLVSTESFVSLWQNIFSPSVYEFKHQLPRTNEFWVLFKKTYICHFNWPSKIIDLYKPKYLSAIVPAALNQITLVREEIIRRSDIYEEIIRRSDMYEQCRMCELWRKLTL